MILLAIFTLFLLGFPWSLACSTEMNSSKESDFSGRWALNCNKSGWISISSKEEITMEVNANQIYINATGHIGGQKLIIKLSEPAELGLGGMSLGWGGFSRVIPIAEIQRVSDKTVEIKWFGFYDTVSNSRKWTSEPDFFDPENNVLAKCSPNLK